jgi:hypothetical protein
VTGAAEILTIPAIKTSDDDEAYEFEVAMSGYYSDPIPNVAMKKELKAKMTHTNHQTIFASAKGPLFKAVLGSAKMRIGSRLFIEGDYRLAYEKDEEPGYIELNHVSFNTTGMRNEQSLPESVLESGGRRRTVKAKGKSNLPVTPSNNRFQNTAGPSTISPSPVTPFVQPQFGPALQQAPTQQQELFRGFSTPNQLPPSQSVASAPLFPHQETPSSSPAPATPYTGTSIHSTPASGGSVAMPPALPTYHLDEFLDIDGLPPSSQYQLHENSTVSPSELTKGKRRAPVEQSTRSKRIRKPTAKATALRFQNVEASEEGDQDETHVTDEEDGDSLL